jgi:hypothetical protein
MVADAADHRSDQPDSEQRFEPPLTTGPTSPTASSGLNRQ